MGTGTKKTEKLFSAALEAVLSPSGQKDQTRYEHRLMKVKKSGRPAKYARLTLPSKYPRIHYELPEFVEVLALVEKHGLYLVTESLAHVGFRLARVAKEYGDRDYAEEANRISTKLMITIANHHEAANEIRITSWSSVSDKRMNEVVDAIGFHWVVEALSVATKMASENILQAGDNAMARKVSVLADELGRVGRQSKLIYST